MTMFNNEKLKWIDYYNLSIANIALRTEDNYLFGISYLIIKDDFDNSRYNIFFNGSKLKVDTDCNIIDDYKEFVINHYKMVLDKIHRIGGKKC